MLEDFFLELDFSKAKVPDHADRTLADNAVSNIDVILKVLCELTSLWKVRMVSVNLDGELSGPFLVYWRNRSVLSRNLLAVDGCVPDVMSCWPKTRDPLGVRKLKLEKVSIWANLFLLDDLKRELVIIILFDKIEKVWWA